MEHPSSRLNQPWWQAIQEYSLYAAWTVALVATTGSLYFSEVAGFLPCMLCWYQRIAMYPLVLILLVGILLKDTKAWAYGLPLAIIGWFIAAYHNLLYYNVLTESAATCRAGVSCTTQHIAWFGFLTIPLLSFMAFTLIIILLLMQRKVNA